ncbi:MAG: hypothetical protein IKK87_08515 [Bacteroidaceae bacterium]|nr:hypothetical protein [Bacteroidaceae bacterium]
MQVVINRKTRNPLYTEGTLNINGQQITFTVEATEVMLPTGHYTLKIVKLSERKQKLYLFSGKQRTHWTIGISHSWVGSKKKHLIAIGHPLIPGVVYQATSVYNRLVDRLSKCMDRKEPIHLTISDSHCRPNHPISHWLIPGHPETCVKREQSQACLSYAER